jgi:hypothetical protein
MNDNYMIHMSRFSNGYVILVAGGYTYLIKDTVDDWRGLVSAAIQCCPSMCADLHMKSDCVMYSDDDTPEFSVIKDVQASSSWRSMCSYGTFDTCYRMGKAGVHPMNVDRREVDLAYWKAAESEAAMVLSCYIGNAHPIDSAI